uniref:Putative trna guanine37-n1-methyltransferase-like protein n=1 Tax=Tabanus bromius TaxID=304241 RepID=A0A0K8TPR4_TABBR
MARKGRSAGKKPNSAEKKGAAGKPAINKTKKDKNVFKVNDSKNKKKPREVQVKLKKLKETVKNKQEAVDNKFKDLHKDIVNEKPAAKVGKKANKKTKAPANTKKVESKLEKMQV